MDKLSLAACACPRPLPDHDALSFGWSAGDIVSVEIVSTLVKVGKALEESGGATTDYQDAVNFLEGIDPND